jgi:predicted nucleic acid-binding protein
VSEAVADAGPLIHLREVECLSLLTVFDAIHAPDAVWQETADSGRVPEVALLSLEIIHRHSLLGSEVTRYAQANGLETLHGGERESLYLCRQIGVPILLTDDLAVREACKRLALTPVGSLGIVARAYRMGKLSLAEAERSIEALYDVSTLFVTRTIVDLAIEQLRSHPPRAG